jgi:hypothetical protein
MLVAATVTITTTPVELLPGEDLAQTYEIRFGDGVGSGFRIGPAGVTAATGFDPNVIPLGTPLRLQGESLWAVALSTPVDLSVLAYSTGE